MTSLNLGRLVVEVVSSSDARPRRAIVEPGGFVEVGRTERASLVVAADPQLSARHCRVEWSASGIRVVDLASAGGTLLNGERVDDAPATHGAWLRLGTTDLRLWVEGHSGLVDPLAEPPLDAKKAAVLDVLARENDLYAVVDAARGSPLELLHESVDTSVSLYDGIEGASLRDVAPHLVELRADSGLLERLVRIGWGRRWGIFLVSPRSLLEVRRHLRRFLMVEDEESQKKFYFRFYDPFTLKSFLPTCTRLQRDEFFGPVDRFLFEGPSGAVLVEERQAAERFP